MIINPINMRLNLSLVKIEVYQRKLEEEKPL